MQIAPANLTAIAVAALISFGVTTALVKLAIRICTARSWVAQPRRDRWHRGTPCLFGGVPLWGGFVVVCVLFVRDPVIWKVIGLSSAMFVLGFADDILRLRPRIKLLVQVANAILLVSIGVIYPVSTNLLVCAVFSILWVIGITNAFNLLDNMDGLASGVALIATVYLAVFYYLQGDSQHALVLAIFAAALGGFLVFNFNPARIFMGDTGSLAIGFFLSGATLLRIVHLANVTAFLFIPVLLLAVPLFDTFFVSVTRRLRGQPVSQGGTDHSSHRFVKLGLSERNAVFFLYGMCTISGTVTLVVRTMRFHDALAVVMAWFFVLFVFGVHLFQPHPGHIVKLNSLPNLVRRVMSRDVLALLLDPAALALGYYLSYILRFRASDREWVLFYEALPIIVIAKFGSLYLTGTYRRSWWRGSFFDLWGIARAIGLGELISVCVLTGVYRFTGYSRVIFLLDSAISWAFLVAIRSSFKLFQHVLFAVQVRMPGRAVFLMGTSEHTDVALQFLRKIGIRCVGLIDSNGGADRGRRVWGVQVLGRVDDIGRLANQHQVFEIVLPQDEQSCSTRSELAEMCGEWGVTLTTLGLHAEPAGKADFGMPAGLLDTQSDLSDWNVHSAESA